MAASRFDPRATDIWRVGIVAADAATILRRGGVGTLPVTWLAERGRFTYDADPFGLWRDEILHLFVEAFDYRTRHGTIDVLRFDATLRPIDRRTCLYEPWHLSYPVVFEADGTTWLLPEAFKSGTLTLYRCVDFPRRWEPAARIDLDAPAVDATPFRHEGRWWLAYAPGTDKGARQGRLHLAFADRLTGPWRVHPDNPIRIDQGGARPGGSVVQRDGMPVLPVQDCSESYGGGLRPLRFTRLTVDSAETELEPPLDPPASAGRYRAGFHTLSDCGPVALIDVKRVDLGAGGRAIDARRILRGLLPRTMRTRGGGGV